VQALHPLRGPADPHAEQRRDHDDSDDHLHG
jgi:hypothetical protein